MTKAKPKAIPSGTPFDALMRGLVQVPKDEMQDQEKKLAAAKAKRAKGKKK
jgi:hypothetical protein